MLYFIPFTMSYVSLAIIISSSVGIRAEGVAEQIVGQGEGGFLTGVPDHGIVFRVQFVRAGDLGDYPAELIHSVPGLGGEGEGVIGTVGEGGDLLLRQSAAPVGFVQDHYGGYG